MSTSSKITNSHKYHYCYKITNLFPVGAERFYVGVRSCSVKPEKDNYWGSSIYLNEAIKQQGQIDFAKEILSVWKTREEAMTEEIRLHAEIGVKDNPEYYNRSNSTSTGFDYLGVVPTEETRQKLSSASLTMWQDPEYRKYQLDRLQQMHKDPEISDRMKNSLKKAVNTSAEKSRRSEAAKKYWQDSDYRERLTKERKERMSAPETRMKVTERNNKLWADPDFRKKTLEKINEFGLKNRKMYLLTDPNGVNYSIVGIACEGGLKDFSKQNNLSAQMLQMICRGSVIPQEGTKYFGWTGSVVRQ